MRLPPHTHATTLAPHHAPTPQHYRETTQPDSHAITQPGHRHTGIPPYNQKPKKNLSPYKHTPIRPHNPAYNYISTPPHNHTPTPPLSEILVTTLWSPNLQTVEDIPLIYHLNRMTSPALVYCWAPSPVDNISSKISITQPQVKFRRIYHHSIHPFTSHQTVQHQLYIL